MAAKISYLGIPGSYSHQACEELFEGAAYHGFNAFSDAIAAVQSGTMDYAVIPVENSTAGRITEVYNILPSLKLHIVGEHLLPIHHCLVVPSQPFRGLVPQAISDDEAKILAWKASDLTADEKAAAFKQIREIQSHPQALMQCEEYIKKQFGNIKTTPVADTATAARELGKRKDCEVAAIGSRTTADIYKLFVLVENIEDDPSNMTRFLIFAREPFDVTKYDGPAITSIVFKTKHVPGSLIGALQAFAKHGINLTKLETYMLNQRHPQPTFYVDVGASTGEARMKEALESFKAHCAEFSLLGSYPASPARGINNGFLPVEGPLPKL